MNLTIAFLYSLASGFFNWTIGQQSEGRRSLQAEEQEEGDDVIWTYAPPSFRYTPFHLLDERQKFLVQELGYNESTWNMPGTNPFEKLSYSSMNCLQQEIVTELGWDEDLWDCDPNHYWDYDWKDLKKWKIVDPWIALGYDQCSWELGCQGPESDDKYWANLTLEEKLAANRLCYFEGNWDEIDLRDLYYSGVYPSDHQDGRARFLKKKKKKRKPARTKPLSDEDGDGTWTYSPPSFRYTPFHLLNERTKNLAEQLGYNESTWNMLGTNPIEYLSYSSMECYQQEILKELGFDEDHWDCDPNHYWDYDWADLVKWNFEYPFQVLGYTECSWDGGCDGPPVEDKSWTNLTAEEQWAANQLCFVEQTWDEIDLRYWYANATI